MNFSNELLIKLELPVTVPAVLATPCTREGWSKIESCNALGLKGNRRSVKILINYVLHVIALLFVFYVAFKILFLEFFALFIH